MAPAFLVVLLAAGTLLSSTEAQEAYDNLPETFKKGVDLAVQHVNSHANIQQLFLFFKSLQKSSIDSGFNVNVIYHHFYLKATKCSKATENPDTKKCPFRNDRPLIDCALCYKAFSGKIEENPVPYVNCVHKPVLTEEMKATRVERCNAMGYSIGAATLLASTGTD
uniref:Retinoic acid receptor responder protein 2 n=1 Tax=Denticeps clupeoides TaxID=299321 RepID=A0AAY4DUW7_9TELE